MLKQLVIGKIHRALEATDLSIRVTKDMHSRAALLSCYAGIMRDPNDPSEVSFELRFADLRFPITIRKSDIFTLAEIFFDREYAIQSRVPENPLVLDCGANVGLSAIWFLSQWPGARVHAVEPEPANFRLLEMNLGRYSEVVLNRAAVGKENGSVTLHVAEHGAMHSVKSASSGSRRVEVPCVNLGDYLRSNRLDHLDILKLDVEGSELEAIEGLGGALDSVGIIVGELHERFVDETKFYRYTEERGFRRIKRTPAREEGVHLFELARR